jgi:putative NADH-flavin reductase
MKVLVLAATGGTGRLIVRDALAKGHSVVALVRSKASADLPGVDMIEGDARDGGTLIRALNGREGVVSSWERQGRHRPRRRQWRQDCTRRCRSVRGGATEHLVEANTCSLMVKGAESPRLMHDPEAVPPMQRVDFSRVQEPTYCRTI